MQQLPQYRRILLLTEGHLGVFTAKTAASLLRYRAADIVGILDGAAAGEDVRRRIPWALEVPIVGSIAAAARLRPDAIFVGIAPVGGALPDSMRRHLREALNAGLGCQRPAHAHAADAGLREQRRHARAISIRSRGRTDGLAAMRAIRYPASADSRQRLQRGKISGGVGLAAARGELAVSPRPGPASRLAARNRDRRGGVGLRCRRRVAVRRAGDCDVC